MKAWLWGGLIGTVSILFLIFIVPVVVDTFCYQDLTTGLREGFACDISYFLGNLWKFFDFLSWPFCGGFCVGEEGMIQFITTIPSFFVIGAIIGWIVGKIRSINQ